MALELSTRQVQHDKPNKQFPKKVWRASPAPVNVLFLMSRCTPTTTQMDIMICYFRKHGFQLKMTPRVTVSKQSGRLGTNEHLLPQDIASDHGIALEPRGRPCWLDWCVCWCIHCSTTFEEVVQSLFFNKRVFKREGNLITHFRKWLLQH